MDCLDNAAEEWRSSRREVETETGNPLKHSPGKGIEKFSLSMNIVKKGRFMDE